MSRLDVAVLVAAAGSGTRLGLGAKAYVRVRGVTLLDRVLEVVRGSVAEVVVALPPDADVEAAALAAPDVTWVRGGETRQASVAAMLRAAGHPLVAVHDVARPLLTLGVLERVCAAAAVDGAASAALAVADTVYDTAAARVLDRSRLRLIQTPQAFDRALVLAAHEAAARDAVAVTDDAELVRRLGRSVTLVEGSSLLHKVTTPDDVALVAALYERWLDARASEATDA